MEQHRINYFKFFNILQGEDYFCEICERPATGGIHHIEARGMGSKKTTVEGLDIDHISNLMALCRECHVAYGDITEFRPYLQEIHQKRMNMYVRFGLRPGEEVAYKSIGKP